MCCNKKIAKAILITLNIVFALLGVVCIVAGVLILIDKTVLTSAISKIPFGTETLDQALQTASLLQRAAYVIIVAGAIIGFIGFCGCCGAFKEVKLLLIIYSIIVALILAVQIAAVVIGFLYTGRVTTYMQTFLNKTIAEKYTGLRITNGSLTEAIEPYSAAWDIAMISLECCGNNDYADFSAYAGNWNNTYTFSGVTFQAVVPITCCKTTDKTGLISDLTHFTNYFTNASSCLTTADATFTNRVGCYDKLKAYLDKYSKFVIGASIAVACIELIAIICACSVIRLIGKGDD